jgi:magnesium transporter
MTAPLGEHHLNNPITHHMRKDCTGLYADWTIAEALDWLRQNPPQDRIIYFYVVDREKRLVGVLPTRRLLLNPPDTPLAEIMVERVAALPESATVLEACEFFIQHHLLAFPVVDEQRRLLGVVDVDLYTEEMSDLDQREGRDHLFQLIGVHLTEAEQANPLVSFRRRFPWLLCNITGGILAALLSGIYQRELAWGDAVLALFIPVVLALAESVGIQSVSLALETLRGRPPSWASLLPRLGRELLTGLFLGGASALALMAVALVWLGQWRVAGCLLSGIGGGVACAAVLGLAVPNLLRLLRLDPRVAAGPVALAFADMATLLLYFNAARWLLP